MKEEILKEEEKYEDESEDKASWVIDADEKEEAARTRGGGARELLGRKKTNTKRGESRAGGERGEANRDQKGKGRG